MGFLGEVVRVDVLEGQDLHQEYCLLLQPLVTDAFLLIKLLTKRHKRTTQKRLRYKSMSNGIPIIGQHQYLLKLLTSKNLQLKYTFLGPYSNILKMMYGIPDRKSRRILINAPNFEPLPHDIFRQPIYCFY